jgi:DNA-binding FadR family transcriptional regulator
VPASSPPPAVAPESFEAIRSARAFEDIAAQIRAELTAGRLKVGSRLPPERALAEQFGVSRNTLREALRSLEHAGLIRLQKGASGGAFISERSGDAVVTGLLDLYHVGAIGPAQLTQARIWLESIIVREACQRATAGDLAELRGNIEAAEAAAARGDFEGRVERNLEFHRILARMTGNPIVVLMLDGMLAVLRHFIKTIGDHHNPYTLPSRRRFLKHMEEGDVAAAVAEMESSLKRLERAYLSRIEPQAPGVSDAQPAGAVARKVPARKAPARKAAAAR